MTLGGDELHEIKPLLAHAGNGIRHARPELSIRMPVEELNAADTGLSDRREVGGHALLGRITPDDVKPRLGGSGANSVRLRQRSRRQRHS